MGLQISIRKSGDVTILDLQGKATIGADSDLLSIQLKKMVAKGVQKLLLNLRDLTRSIVRASTSSLQCTFP